MSDVILGRHELGALTTRIVDFNMHPPRGLLPLMVISGAGTLMFFAAMLYTLVAGIGTWGNNIPVAWCFAITNFVWWIGIGHAGTFISAILLLLRQRWRTSINRLAETMTLFAVVQAMLFPILHMGRAWFAYWLIPYPEQMGVWPQFRSSLTWDVGAITTYGTISLLFWYVGLIPDLAAARDHAVGAVRRRVYGLFALGWRGTSGQWQLHAKTSLLLGGLATPLVVSVHSVVSLDFAIAIVHGWHSTIFPPYFVAGALFSGFAMLCTLIVPIRWVYRLEDVITTRHLEMLGKMILLLSLVLAYAYAAEHILAWNSSDEIEREFTFHLRPAGPYAFWFWLTFACNVAAPQVLWFKRLRRSPAVLFAMSLVVNLGMWLERFVIIAGSLSRDYLPSSWATFKPSWIDAGLFTGSLCFFAFLFLLFLRFVPFIPLSELKAEVRRG